MVHLTGILPTWIIPQEAAFLLQSFQEAMSLLVSLGLAVMAWKTACGGPRACACTRTGDSSELQPGPVPSAGTIWRVRQLLQYPLLLLSHSNPSVF